MANVLIEKIEAAEAAKKAKRDAEAEEDGEDADDRVSTVSSANSIMNGERIRGCGMHEQTDLAELCRIHYPRQTVFAVAAANGLFEVPGSALRSPPSFALLCTFTFSSARIARKCPSKGNPSVA